MKYVLGIDVGGTKIASALVKDNKLEQLLIEPTSKTDLLGQLMKIIGQYQGFEAIGVAVPGPVLADGTVVKLPNIPSFPKTNLKQILEEKFKLPVNVANDAKAFALAEATLGLGQDKKVVA